MSGDSTVNTVSRNDLTPARLEIKRKKRITLNNTSTAYRDICAYFVFLRKPNIATPPRGQFSSIYYTVPEGTCQSFFPFPSVFYTIHLPSESIVARFFRCIVGAGAAYVQTAQKLERILSISENRKSHLLTKVQLFIHIWRGIIDSYHYTLRNGYFYVFYAANGHCNGNL